MKKQHIINKVKRAAEKDPEILSDKNSVESTLGSDAKYLEEQLGLTKSDLIRLERLGLAMKARYQTKGKKHVLMPDGSKVEVTGPHRIRWVIWKEAVQC